MHLGRESDPAPRRWSLQGASLVKVLIILNVVVFGVQLLVDHYDPFFIQNHFALSRAGLREGQYWQFISYMFLHGSAMHLLVNCLGLFFAGREIESILGKKHFLGIYFLGGLLGGIAQILVGNAVIGASAGVCAVLLAFTTILPELEITALIFFVIPLKMRAKWLGRAVIVTSILFASVGFSRDIGHIAHLTGALTGWLYTRRLGYGGAFMLQRFVRDRKRLRERRDRMDSTEFISEEIDPILDKISREGIHSLTRAERRILELGREKISNKISREL